MYVSEVSDKAKLKSKEKPNDARRRPLLFACSRPSSRLWHKGSLQTSSSKPSAVSPQKHGPTAKSAGALRSHKKLALTANHPNLRAFTHTRRPLLPHTNERNPQRSTQSIPQRQELAFLLPTAKRAPRPAACKPQSWVGALSPPNICEMGRAASNCGGRSRKR